MKYTITVEVDQFRDRALRARAKMKEISVEDVLTEIVNDKVIVAADTMVADALNTKLSGMSAGLALAQLEAMEVK